MEVKKLSEKEVLRQLEGVLDPELGCNIVDLGLIYGVEVKGKRVEIKMTLTSPGCPLGQIIGREVEKEVKKIKGVKTVKISFVFNPAWSPERMAPQLRKQLGF